MNKYIITTLLIAIMINPLLVLAADNNSDASRSSSLKETINKNFNNIKENIATIVAEFTKKSTMVISGNIESIGDSNITVKLTDSNKQIVETDEITKYQNILEDTVKNIEKKDLKLDQYVVVFGNRSNTNFTSNNILISNDYVIFDGEVSNINNTTYLIEIVTPEKDIQALIVELDTDRKVLNSKTYQFETIGFSKIEIGDKIHAVAYRSGSKQNQYSAVKIIIIPQEYFNSN